MLPQYAKTLAVYEYLKDNATPTGQVPLSRRQIAQGMGYKTWSSITWHLDHLERAGLIARDHVTRKRNSLFVILRDNAAELISRVPRIPWTKYKDRR